LESVEIAEEYTRSISKDEFMKSMQVQDAVIRRLEIIGEAAKSIPNDFRRKHPDVPWSEIARMRDKLVHGYFGVDLQLTWDVVMKDLPDLREKVKNVLRDMNQPRETKV
jgi:uncharacterized protein with HEPN domain